MEASKDKGKFTIQELVLLGVNALRLGSRLPATANQVINWLDEDFWSFDAAKTRYGSFRPNDVLINLRELVNRGYLTHEVPNGYRLTPQGGTRLVSLMPKAVQHLPPAVKLVMRLAETPQRLFVAQLLDCLIPMRTYLVESGILVLDGPRYILSEFGEQIVAANASDN